MHDVDIDTALKWRGLTVVDRADTKIGTLKEIYLDEDERPRWGSVHMGLFGTRETLVPLTHARRHEDVLRLPFDRDHVERAPNLDPDVQLRDEEEARLYRHYGLGSSSVQDSSEAGAVVASPSSDEPHPPAQRAKSSAKDAMTRSEEELRISKRPRERGRARLKKYVVTDYVEKK